MNSQRVTPPLWTGCILLSTVLCSQGVMLLEKSCAHAQTYELAQTPVPIPGTLLPEERLPPPRPPDPRQGEPPSRQPLPEQRIEPLPNPDQLLPSTPTSPDQTPVDAPQRILVKRFQVTGSTVFSQQELVGAIENVLFKGEAIPPEGKEITLADLFQVRSAITDLYTSRGYITSGAFIPPQRLEEGVVEVRVLEGTLEDIRVTGTQKLEPGYISSRIGIATKPPLNRDRLLEALQILQLNPLIANISAELSAGSRPGTSLLEVKVTEADSSFMQFTFDNGRSPSVGTIRRQIFGTELNTLGYGDTISLSFTNTDGSNALDFSYTLPVSPYNTTVNFSAGLSASDVIEEPFDILDIHSESNYLELTGRHPLIQTPTQDLALGLTLSRRSTRTEFIEDLPFPSPGADDEGRTKVSTLRFFQEWTKRSSLSVFAVRSQFNIGLPILDATQQDDPPDSNFFSWRSQAQWVRLLAPDTLLLVKGDLQLADRPILPVEQFGLGGLLSIRGYRQDLLLTDNGLFGSVEVRIPVLRLPKQQALFQFAPFVDFGRAWNNSNSPDPDPGTLASLGFGIRLQISTNFTARMDFGFPLVSVDSRKETWQEKGIYFSIIYSPF